MTDDSKTTPWQPIETIPQDGSWVLVEHPDTTIPAIARPIGPGSQVFEHFWTGGSFRPSRQAKWMPIP
jgi:hypothetical protein